VEGEEKSERNEHVQSVNESGANFGRRNPFIRKLGGANGAHLLADQ
jgi:hypothetical protein